MEKNREKLIIIETVFPIVEETRFVNKVVSKKHEFFRKGIWATPNAANDFWGRGRGK